MTASELTTVLAWLIFPPALLGVTGLVWLHHHNQSTFKRCILACAIFLALSCFIAFSMVVFGPESLGSYLGVKDTPFMWAPFAFISVAIAFPFAALWLRHPGVK